MTKRLIEERRKQGLPPKVEDPSCLRRIAQLLQLPRAEAEVRDGGK